jgi:hypothetical protein
LYTRLLTCALLAAVATVPARAGAPGRVGAAGVTIALPSGWHSARPVQGAVTNPLTRVVASSGPIGPKLTRCDAQIADYSFPARAVAIVVVEWTQPVGGMKIGSDPRRPRHFSFAVRRPPAIECWPGPGGGTEWAEKGRSLAAYVLLGRQAPARLASRARAVLDTLRVAPR